ncbi:DUF4845 domain-containing protein [Neptunomonas phycophila]|uniref:DUF4845 domain-containing protein n=1 Tax=Neptunomonas phycophila TaxID=1572645 RepID=UPI003BAD0532
MILGTSLRQQRGASFFGTLIVVLMIGTFIAIGFKLYSPYLQHGTLTSVVENVANDREELSKPINVIRNNINKRLTINQVKLPSPEALTIVNEQGVIKFTINYEQRVPMFYNIDAVVKFNDYYEASQP